MSAMREFTPLTTLEPLLPGMRVLVVGDCVLTRELEEDDRVIHWPSESRQAKNAVIPADVSLVIFTRAINHNTSDYIKREALKRHIRVENRLMNNGVLRRSLNILVGRESPTSIHDVLTTAQPQMLTQKLGAIPMKTIEVKNAPKAPSPAYRRLIDFVQGEYVPREGETFKAAALRLEPKMRELKLDFKFGGLLFTIQEHARKLGIKSPRRAKNPAPTPPTVERAHQPVEPPVLAVAKDAPPVLEATTVVDSSPSNTPLACHPILQLLDDAVTALQLAREEFIRLEAQNAELRDRHARLKKALGDL